VSAPIPVTVEWSQAAGYVLRACQHCNGLGHVLTGITDIRRGDQLRAPCGAFVIVERMVRK
jgi:hypothetical protein